MAAVLHPAPARIGTGLALSGGGFRATLFHLGALIRMNEMGLLGRVDQVSSVSGGSILAGHLALNWLKLAWDTGNPAGLPVATNFDSVVTASVIGVCNKKLDIAAAAIGDLIPFFHAANILAGDLRKYCFGKATLQNITSHPEFIFVSTNLQTGRTFRFSKNAATDSSLGIIDQPTFQLAEAVTASAAFPPFFTPYKLDVGDMKFRATPYSNPALGADYKQTLYLSDGGVYDNLGLEPVLNNCKEILVSDAGSPLEPTADFAGLSVQVRVTDVMMAQGLGPRKRDLIQRFIDDATRPADPNSVTGAYWGIATDISKYGTLNTLPVNPAVAMGLAQAGTQLRPFPEDVQYKLINWGYAVCDAAIRRWHAGPKLQTPPALPNPGYPLT